MAELWVSVAKYNLPVFCASGVSHYVPAKVVWEMAILDDGFSDISMKSIDIREEYGNA